MADGTARDEWAGLDRQTRREIRRNGRRLRPHPDPAVSAVAARYAREMLDRTSRKILVVRLAAPAAAYLVLVKVLTSLDTSGTSAGVDVVIMAVAFVACLAAMVHAWIGLRRSRLLTRIKMANWLAPGATSLQPAPAPGHPASGDGSLAVRYVPRKLVTALAVSFAVTCVVVGFWVFEATSWHGWARAGAIVILAVIAAVFLMTIAGQAWTLARWAVPGRPIIDLDAGGARLHAITLVVPWPVITEIGLFSVRAGLGRTVAIVGLRCEDPSAVLDWRRLGWTRRRMMRRAARIYGTPFTISTSMTDQTADRIAAAASGFAGVPVRRH